MKKSLAIILVAITILSSAMLTSCRSQSNDKPATTNAQNSTVATSTTTTAKSESTTEAVMDEDDYVISVEEAKNAITNMYPEYEVKNTKIEDNVIYFDITDNGKKYATVKVDLVTADAYETTSSANQLTVFNLLS